MCHKHIEAQRKHTVAARKRLAAQRKHIVLDRKRLADQRKHRVVDRKRLAAQRKHSVLDRKRIAAQRKHSVADKTCVLDMEVLIATEGHPILLDWLNYMCQQIEEKNYAGSTHWRRWKMIYIHQTTGPKCMSRFLKLKDNSQVHRKLQFVSCNNFARGRELTTAERGMFDVLSYESNSYYGERNAFTSQVGDGNGSVPDLDGSQLKLQLRRRITGKRQLNDTDVATNRIEPTNPATRSDQGAHVGDCDIPTCSQPSCVAAELISDSEASVTPPDCQRQRLTAQSGSDTDELPDAADVALNSLGDEQFRQAPRVLGFRLRAKTSLHSTARLKNGQRSSGITVAEHRR